MASAIDPTLPVQGSPTTASVRANFLAAKNEIETLQATAGVGPQGPVGPTGPSGTISVGTVTTGAAGTSASVTNAGSTTAATFNFVIPRGDAGTGGSGITETQAKDAVRQGNIKFEESPETTAVTFPTTPNLAGAPVLGANWTLSSGAGATGTYTHAIGGTETLAYPATIATGTTYQVVFSMGNTTGTSTAVASFFSLYFRTGPTVSTGQQTVFANVSASLTVTLTATGNFSHVVIVPVSGWQGTFSMTRVAAFSGAQNSVSLSVKDWMVKARGTSLYVGSGGKLATGVGNISIGSGALDSLTTGTDNIAIGQSALNGNVAASNNVAIGQNALLNNLSGSSNVALGPSAMYSNQSGSSNVALGPSAIYSNQTGSNNVGVGSNALNSNQTGTYNVGVGAGALNENRTGSYNIALGYYALGYVSETSSYSVGVASYSIGIGYWAGWSINGTHNISIGHYALTAANGPPVQSNGSYLVALGSYAGRHFGTTGNYVTDAHNSVFLGAHTKAAGNSQTNQNVIGYDALGHGSNTITLGNNEITALHCQVQTISALSDERVKENIQAANLDMCLNAVKNLPVSRWGWQPIAGAHNDKHVTGFLADDVAKVFPKAITKEDRFLTVRDAQGKPEMTSVTEPVWTPPQNGATEGKITGTQTRQIEKTVEIKGLQYVSTSEMLPTLWAAVQALIQQVEALQKQSNPAGNPVPAS